MYIDDETKKNLKQLERLALLDEIASKLNNWMEAKENAKIYCKEFGCAADELVDQFGFGYAVSSQELSYLSGDEINPVTKPLEAIERVITNMDETDTLQQRILIDDLLDLEYDDEIKNKKKGGSITWPTIK